MLLSSGNVGRAEALARIIIAPDWALTELATAAVVAGDVDRAEAFARSITDPTDQAEALIELAIAPPRPVTSTGPGTSWPSYLSWTCPKSGG